MSVFQGAASFVGRGYFVQYNVDSPKLPDNSVLFAAAWSSGGYSSPAPWDLGMPEADPTVKVLNAQFAKQQGVPKLP